MHEQDFEDSQVHLKLLGEAGSALVLLCWSLGDQLLIGSVLGSTGLGP